MNKITLDLQITFIVPMRVYLHCKTAKFEILNLLIFVQKVDCPKYTFYLLTSVKAVIERESCVCMSCLLWWVDMTAFCGHLCLFSNTGQICIWAVAHGSNPFFFRSSTCSWWGKKAQNLLAAMKYCPGEALPSVGR